MKGDRIEKRQLRQRLPYRPLANNVFNKFYAKFLACSVVQQVGGDDSNNNIVRRTFVKYRKVAKQITSNNPGQKNETDACWRRHTVVVLYLYISNGNPGETRR